MAREYTVKEAGYAYVYISNENPAYIQVYFDDVTVSYTPTNIIQYNEYYPYGLRASTSWTRENNSNNYLYNAANELNEVTGWYETMFRDYDPVLGRFMQVDPLASKYSAWSPYHYAFNNPVMFNDPNGAEGIQPGPPDWVGQLFGPRVDEATMSNAQWINHSRPAGTAGGGYNGPSGPYMAQGYAQIQGTEAWNKEMNLKSAASRGDMNAIRELARRNGDLIKLEHWVYEGGTIIDGVKHPTEQYDFWVPAAQQGCPPGVNCNDGPWIRNKGDFNPPAQAEVNNLPGYLLTGLGTAMTGAEGKLYNGKTWYSLRQMKTYSVRFKGNQYTESILTAKNTATGLKIGGYGLGAYNAFSITQQYNSGSIGTWTLVTEQASNTYSTLGGVYGAAWGVGWEIGRAITSFEWYQNWKQDTWLPWRKENLGY